MTMSIGGLLLIGVSCIFGACWITTGVDACGAGLNTGLVTFETLILILVGGCSMFSSFSTTQLDLVDLEVSELVCGVDLTRNAGSGGVMDCVRVTPDLS